MSKKSRAADEQLRLANEQIAAQQHTIAQYGIGDQPSAVGYSAAPPATAKRGMRKFSWVIIIVNVIFLAWVIAGIASAGHGTNCGTLDQETCDAAQGIGATIGVGIIFLLWAFVDFILLVLWLITRPRQR